MAKFQIILLLLWMEIDVMLKEKGRIKLKGIIMV